MYTEHIQFNVNQVKEVSLAFSLYYKPIWKTLENYKPDENLKIVDRFSPFESISCEWALAQVYSQMSQYIVPKRAEYLRTLASELQVVLWNLNYIKNILSSLEEQVYIQHFYSLRDMILDLQEMWMGSRVLPQFLNLTGVERDLTVGILGKMQTVMLNFEREYMQVYQLLKEDTLLMNRLEGVMIMPTDLVRKLNCGGLLGFANGINMEVKWKHSYGAYANLDIFTPDSSLCNKDAKSRFLISLDWMRHTLVNMKQLTENMPEGAYHLNEKEVFEPKEGYFVSAVDAPSGPLYACYAFKKIFLSSSSLRLRPFVESLFKGQHIEDYDLAYHSLGFDISQGALF